MPLPPRRRPPVATFSSDKRPRFNDQIRVAEVLLVNDDGPAKRMTTAEALALAKAEELDLIEVSPKAVPPVVKIGDYGQYLYQLQKKERKQRAHSKQTEVKMLRLGFRTDKHDIERLMDRAREFLAERHLVKFVIRLRGRELTNKDYAAVKMKAIIADMADVAEVEQDMKAQGTTFVVVLRAKR